MIGKRAIKGIESSNVGGTDLIEAVITSSNLLSSEEAKAVILISDGRINVGSIDELISYANKNDLIVHTIGIGTIEGGQTSYGLSKLDEDALKAIAFNTGGNFFSAPDQSALQESLGTILELETKMVSIDLSSYLLILAILLCVIEFVMVNTRFKSIP